MSYVPPINEYQFLFRHLLELRAMSESQEDVDEESAVELLESAGRLIAAEIVPLQRSGDRYPAALENGVVRTPPGFARAYAKIAEGGWIGMTADPEYGGLGLPLILRGAFTELLNSACMAFGLNPMLTQCQIDTLERHGSDVIKRKYLPRLITGEWCGTMNISEPQAGSDVGAIRSKAVQHGEHFKLTGQKNFISWADADFASNICHLVLARLPGAPFGTRGLSLFLVPKFLLTDDGELGHRNSVRVASLEDKLGMHGSPTAVVLFEDADAWLVGKPNGGLEAMFTMMNAARACVGAQGVGIAEAAWQKAYAYASERQQGRPARNPQGMIIDHGNVRRTLMTMKAQIFAARSICAMCSFALDMAKSTGASEWSDRAAVLTPIAKVFGSDTGIEVSTQAIMVHGGAGYLEDSGAAQFLRDGLVAAIYEGTNDIQAADLVGRKLKDCRVEIEAILKEIDTVAKRSPASDQTIAEVSVRTMDAVAEFSEATRWLAGTTSDEARLAGASAYLRAFALLLGAQAHLKAALADKDRVGLANVYGRRILPHLHALCAEACCGSEDVFAADMHSVR